MSRTPTILMVEDDPHVHPLYSDAFSSAGFEVIIRENADDDFVNAVASVNPDIISMDLMMGKEGVATKRDGFQAMEALLADSRTDDIPIIVLTNFFQEDKVARAKALGAIDFINVQGEPLHKIPSHFLRYLEKPRKYNPSHPEFRDA